jgi:hypothetical protein
MERSPRIEKGRTFNAGRRNPNEQLRRESKDSWERQETEEPSRGTRKQQPRRRLQRAPSTHHHISEPPQSLPFWKKLEVLVTCKIVFAPPVAAYVFIVTRYKVPDATTELIIGSLLFAYIGTALRLMYPGKAGSPAETGSSLLKIGHSLIKMAERFGTSRAKVR